MNLRAYYQKLRKIEADIAAPFVVLASKETPDGGKAGVLTYVARAIAARAIADGKAELAGSEEAKTFLSSMQEQWKAANEIRELTEGELKIIRTALKPAAKK